MTTLTERLQSLLDSDASKSKSGLAKACGVSKGAVTAWFNGGDMSQESLLGAASYFGVNPYWLSNGKGSQRQDEDKSVLPANSGDLTIPQYNTGGMGGNGLILRDQPGIIENWSVNLEWIRTNVPGCTSAGNLCIVTGFGDSMPDTYNPGDPVLVDRGVTVCDHDGVYFFRVGHEGFIKRLQRVPGVGIRAISQNKEYETWTITPDMDLEVFGKVLRAWKGKNY